MRRAAAAIAAALVLGGCGSSDKPLRAEVGTEAPAFSTRDLDGNTVRLADYRGETVLLNFWASWCIPCREEFPLLADAHARAGVTVLGVIYNDTDANARAFMEDNGGVWPGLVDDGGIARGYRIGPGIPATIVIAPDGTITHRKLGELRSVEDLLA